MSDDSLKTCITSRILALDREGLLPIPVIDEMSGSLTQFCEAAIEKFIKGQKEHGGNITDRDLDEEVRKELLDIFWYTSAKKWDKI